MPAISSFKRHLLRMRHRGFVIREGRARVGKKPSRFKMSLQDNGFCNRREGCEGLARAYTCERESGRHGVWLRWPLKSTMQNLRSYEANPLNPRIFQSRY